MLEREESEDSDGQDKRKGELTKGMNLDLKKTLMWRCLDIRCRNVDLDESRYLHIGGIRDVLLATPCESQLDEKGRE